MLARKQSHLLLANCAGRVPCRCRLRHDSWKRRSLSKGIVYHGLCLNKEHLQSPQVVADRAACGLITVQGSSLYSEELAGSFKKHLADVIRR